MKLQRVISLKLRGKEAWRFVFFSPMLSYKKWSNRDSTVTKKYLIELLWKTVLFGLLYYFYCRFLNFLKVEYELSWIALSYLCVISFWLITTLIANINRIVYLPVAGALPEVHSWIFFSKNISDFWGHRWDMWIRDWFREAVYQPVIKKTGSFPVALFSAYLVSALFHELILNLPYYLSDGKMLFGSEVLYFIIQPIGHLVSKHLLANSPKLDFLFGYLCVLGPIPLLLNESAQNIFALY